MTTHDQPATERIPSGDPLYHRVMDFLVDEISLLDDGRLLEWLDLLADDVSYRMPVRQTLHRREGRGFADEVTLFDDDKPRLTFRVRRIVESPNSHVEQPPTRSRRFLSSVRAHRCADDVLVSSSILLVQSRWNRSDYDLLSAHRIDLLRVDSNRLLLARREILLDQTVPQSPSLSVFL